MKKIGIFIMITFISTWLIAFTLMANGGYINPLANKIVTLCMLMPSISAILTYLISKKDPSDIWIKLNFKSNIIYYLVAWFLPAILIVFGSIIYYLIFPNDLDLNMTNMVDSMRLQMQFLADGVVTTDKIKSVLIGQVVLSILISPFANFIFSLGEELGWRGYLLPQLCKKYSYLKSSLITGIIWGIWHAPFISMGHNYGLEYKTAPWGGIISMIIFCIIVGFFLCLMTIKTKSCIPATISHGMINGFVATGTLFLTTKSPNLFLGPMPIGILGGSGFLIVGIYCFIKIRQIDKSL